MQTKTRANYSLSKLRPPAQVLWLFLGITYALALISARAIMHKCDPLCFATIGQHFLSGDPNGSIGYDGQFAYFIASDPSDAIRHLDAPAYRLQRILYPLLARALALGQSNEVPLALLFVNVLGVGFGTAAFAELLSLETAPPWMPLLFFAWIGTAYSLLGDLNEITAVALSLWALIFFHRHHPFAAGLTFGLAGLGKDTAFLFSIPLLIYLLMNKRWRETSQIGPLAVLPYLVWMVVISLVLGSWGFEVDATHFETIPFAGLGTWGSAWPLIALVLILPSSICAALGASRWNSPYALMALSGFFFLTFLPGGSYEVRAVFRLTTPLVLTCVLLVCQLRRQVFARALSLIWSATSIAFIVATIQ